MSLLREQTYTIDDIYNLPEGTRAELIDGHMYMMAPPSTAHQRILHFFDRTIGNHIADNHGECEVFPAPFAVFLNDDDKTYVEPDISVICNKDKINEKGCLGAPDWIIEIVSPGSKRMDYYTKLALYRSAGVREYWIADPQRKTILVYDMEHDDGPVLHSFDDKVKVNIYDNLYIDLKNMIQTG